MLQPTPAIQSPSPEILTALLETIESGRLVSGPAFIWDPVRGVFLMALVEGGLITHWQVEPARDQAQADALKARYIQAAAESVRLMLDMLPPEARADIERGMRQALGARIDH